MHKHYFRSDKYIKLLGFDGLARKVRESTHDIASYRKGCFILGTFSLATAYFLYKQRYSRELYESEGAYKLNSALPHNLVKYIVATPRNGINNLLGNTLIENYVKDLQFHQFKATGRFDHTKEIHIPRVKDGEEGYDVFTPFFYFNYPITEFYDQYFYDEKNIKQPEYSGNAYITVNRGW